MTALWVAELAWLGGEALVPRVLLEADRAGRFSRVAPLGADEPAPAQAVTLPGITLPGLANAHSHVFHRALRGRTQRAEAAGDFWAWRERMYALAAVLDPDTLLDLARATYAEMALAGITVVGEFHYLHNQPGGRPYDDANASGLALAAAAADAGVRLTLLDACYLHAGFAPAGGQRPLQGAQLRFGDGDADRWTTRVEALCGAAPAAGTGFDGWRVGAAIHSVRAVDQPSMAAVAAWARAHDLPLHLHLSEQPAENDEALAATGATPAQLADGAGALGVRTVAVHATHVSAGDAGILGARDTGVCLCPTTERDLGDGVGPAGRLAVAGVPLSLGTDSHAVVDLFEEARLVELHERLVRRTRGTHRPDALLEAATAGGYRALGWPDGGLLARGALADFVVVDPTSTRLAGLDPAAGVDGLVFAATRDDVTDVVVGGRAVVRDRTHVAMPDVACALHRAITSLWARV